MAFHVPEKVCKECNVWACNSCRIGDAISDESITITQAVRLAKDGKTRRSEIMAEYLNDPTAGLNDPTAAAEPEPKKPRRRTKAPSAERNMPLFAGGRRNTFSQSCACCDRMVEADEGFLAKSSEKSTSWLVVCRICKDDNIPVGQHLRDPGGMTIVEASKAITSGEMTMTDFMKAGAGYFARQAETRVKQEVVDHINLFPMPSVYFPNKEGGLSEVLESDFRQLCADMFTGPELKPKTPKPPMYFKPAKEGWSAVQVKNPGVTHDWTGCYDGTSSPSLCAGWGEQPSSRERKHNSKRPKRCGW